MRKAHILLLGWTAALLVAKDVPCSAQETNAAAVVAPALLGSPNRAVIKQDDLEWLVGRWRCVTKQYLKRQNAPLGSAHEDFLEYFNVYLPFADEHMTLRLTDYPEDRQIAAEFVVKVIYDIGEFRERYEFMQPGGPVFIGTDRIWYGFRPFDHFEFRYTVEKRDLWLWLVLTSDRVRLELIKLDAAPLGNIKNSFVHGGIKDYSPERLSELKRQYKDLEHGAKPRMAEPLRGADGSHPSSSLTNRTSAAAGPLGSR